MTKATRRRVTQIQPVLRIALICALTYVALFGILYFGVTPEQYDIKVGTPAPTQIKASKDIQDTVTTEANRERAAAEVEPSYKSADPTVVREVTAELGMLMDKLREQRASALLKGAEGLTEQDAQNASKALGIDISLAQLQALVSVDSDTMDEAFSDALNRVRETLDATLPQGKEASAVKSIQNALLQQYPENRDFVALLMEAVEQCIRPNMLIDEEITEANRQKARDEVQATWYVKDQEIVSEGQIVTEAQYAMIAALGILDENSVDIKLIVGLALLVALVMLSGGFYLRRFKRDVYESPKSLLLLCIIVVATMALCLALRAVHSYLMPVSLCFLLVALLIDARMAMYMHILLSLLAAALAPAGSGAFCFMLMVASAPAVLMLFKVKMTRTTALLAGVIIGGVNFLVTLSVGLINSAEMNDVLKNAGFAAANGMVAAIMSLGAQPLLEVLFNLATPSRLIELSNPNQPLLRRLLLEASGTYHHSIIVANPAEAACAAIGANGLLARVGAYYHDIGKLKRPMYFKENQMGDNPHDRTDPRVSTAILTAHPRDGAQMAQKARIPEPVIDIIRQHHGDTPVMFFYDKAQKLYGDDVDISAFRYEGPRPKTREAAVVMLADTIEAATRALPNPDPEKIDSLIRKLVRGKLNDGQLDNCPLTFADIEKICGAFSTVLTGVFHERIEYPDIHIPPRGESAEPAQASAHKPAEEEAVAHAH